MDTFISMLRGINVGGRKKIRMAELRRLYESLGLANVTTCVQSGNVVFDSVEQDGSKLGELIEAQIERVFGYSVPVFIRGIGDFRRIIDGNPFLNERNEDIARLYVTFLYAPPPESKLSDLVVPGNEAAEFSVGEGEMFLFCPNGYGRTKLSNSFFERKLNVPATTRNWKTVNASYKLAKER